jgi:hypothetical protein
VNQPTLSKSDAARVLLAAIEDVAMMLQEGAELQRRGVGVIEIQRRLYEAITGKEAPEFRNVCPRRASGGRVMEERKKLTPQQRGRLGGLTTADRMTAQQRSARAAAGQAALRAKFATRSGYEAHMDRVRLRGHGYDVKVGG